jgi:hypothetical protein
MTRLKQLALGGLAAIAIAGAASSALAEEVGTFQNRLNGATIGLPLGAAPPPGLYTGLETFYLGMLAGSGTGGHSTGNWGAALGNAVAPAVGQAVPLLWVPGWSFLGATYSASVVEGFYEWTSCGAFSGCAGDSSRLSGQPIAGGGFVYTNTFIQPINLSWNLGGGWFVAAAFAFTPPDGTRGVGTPNPDYWTFEPSIAISYLASNWVLSANFFYDINTQSAAVCCASAPITNGNNFLADLTALYKVGKWTIGPVGYFEVQTTADTGACIPAPGVNLCGRYETAAAGGLIGYDFGPIDLQVWVTDSFVGQDAVQGPGGLNVWSRIGFKIWGPEAPKPLVAKN